jgi:prepilin peptidase CpaA
MDHAIVDSTLALGALALVLVAAAWHDVRAYRIPNKLIWGGLAAAVLVNLSSPATGASPESVVAGFGIGLLALLPVYALGAAGAGDVKLLALVGAFTGPVDMIGIALMTYITGAAVAAAYVLAPRMPVAVRATAPVAMPLPYSLAIAGGSALWLVPKLT